MGAAASVKPVHGKALCSDVELQQLLNGWIRLGISFTGIMLLAEEKASTTEYSEESDRWEVNEKIVGNTCVVLKTTGDGSLQLRLSARGFNWQHVESSYRNVGKASAKDPALKVVESASNRFSVEDLKQLLEHQKGTTYRKGTRDDFPDFAKRLYEGLSGNKCEGRKPYDMLKNRTGNVAVRQDLEQAHEIHEQDKKGHNKRTALREREEKEQARWGRAAAYIQGQVQEEEYLERKAAAAAEKAGKLTSAGRGSSAAAQASKPNGQRRQPLPDGVIVVGKGAA